MITARGVIVLKGGLSRFRQVFNSPFVQYLTKLRFGGWKKCFSKLTVRSPTAKMQIGRKINDLQANCGENGRAISWPYQYCFYWEWLWIVTMNNCSVKHSNRSFKQARIQQRPREGGGSFAPGCFAGCLLFVEDQLKEALSYKLCDLMKKSLKLLLWNFRIKIRIPARISRWYNSINGLNFQKLYPFLFKKMYLRDFVFNFYEKELWERKSSVLKH